jgi:hypothetical protein
VRLEGGCGGRGAMWREGVKFLCVSEVSGLLLPPRFSLARPQRSLWTGDGLGASNTVLGCVGRKEALGRATGNEKNSGAPQKPLEDDVRDAPKVQQLKRGGS